MKKYLIFLTVITCLLFYNVSKAQISNLTNTSTPLTEYVGWDGSLLATPKSLDLKNKYDGYPINFYTTSSVTQRMTILDNGNVGIGTAFTNPMNLLHINQSDATQVFTQWTNSTNRNELRDVRYETINQRTKYQNLSFLIFDKLKYHKLRFYSNPKAYIERCSS